MRELVQIRFMNILGIGLDLTFVYISFILVFWNKYEMMNPNKTPVSDFQFFLWILLFAGTIFYLFGLYTDQGDQSLQFIILTTFIGVLFIQIITVGLFQLYMDYPFSLFGIVFAAVFQFLGISAVHLALFYISRRFQGQKRMLIIEDGMKSARVIIEKLGKQRGLYRVTKILQQIKKEDLENTIGYFDIVIFSSNAREKDVLIRTCIENGKELFMIPEASDVLMRNTSINQIDDLLVFPIQPPKLTALEAMTKRLMDVGLSIFLILLFSPLMFILYIIIPLSSKGPAIYKQERVGVYNCLFRIKKFRSMISDAEKHIGPVFASEDDPRITKIGRWMRAARFDELPQLFNVLKGEMSLIGPRPERPYFVEQFKKTNPNYTYRFMVKPGMTGLAQIMGKYTSTAEDKLRFDLIYVQDYSLLLDIKILFRTVYILFKRESAVGVKQKDKIIKQE